MRAQIAITRTGVTQASSNHEPPDGGVLARRTNGDFRVTLHRKVSETAVVQLLRSLRALAPDFQMSLEMGDRPVEQLTRQQACHHIALRALGTLERTNETAFMSNLELFDSMLPPTSLQSDNLLRLAKLDLANKDAPTALMQAAPPTSKPCFDRSEPVDAFISRTPDRLCVALVTAGTEACLSTKAPTSPR